MTYVVYNNVEVVEVELIVAHVVGGASLHFTIEIHRYRVQVFAEQDMEKVGDHYKFSHHKFAPLTRIKVGGLISGNGREGAPVDVKSRRAFEHRHMMIWSPTATTVRHDTNEWFEVTSRIEL